MPDPDEETSVEKITDHTETTEIEIATELSEQLILARTGDPSAARRTAELYEYLDNDAEAHRWWHRAAYLGDEAAQLYVKHIFGAAVEELAQEVGFLRGWFEGYGEGVTFGQEAGRQSVSAKITRRFLYGYCTGTAAMSVILVFTVLFPRAISWPGAIAVGAFGVAVGFCAARVAAKATRAPKPDEQGGQK